jgi:hypothetical protein
MIKATDTITVIEGYDAMRAFLEIVWRRHGKPIDEVAFLLGSLKWADAAPVQQIEIEAVCSKPPQAMLAGSDCPGPCRTFGEDLADKEQLVAASGDRFANESFGSAIGIHLRCVDQRHAEIEAGAERSNFVFSTPRVLSHAPCPLAKRRYRLARGQHRSTDGVR